MCVVIYRSVHGKILMGKLVNFVNHELFAKIFLTNIQGYTKNVFGICTGLSLVARFFHANSIYLPVATVSQKISPTKIFLCTVALLPS